MSPNDSKWIKLLRSLYGILFDPILLNILLNDLEEGGICTMVKVAALLRPENACRKQMLERDLDH